MIFGVSGNFLVIFLFFRCKSLRTSANTLIVNLAFSDGIMNIKAPILLYNSYLNGPALGDVACRIYGFIGGLTGTISIITLSVISFDRFFVIKYPLNRTFSNLRVKICLLVTWIYGTFFAVIPALDVGFGKYTYEGYLTSCSFDYLTDDAKIKNFIVVFFFAAWVVPVILISFSYINIWKIVYTRTECRKRGGDSVKHVREEDKRKQEIKLAVTVLFTIVLWFVSWTPYAVVALLGVAGYRDCIPPVVSLLPALFCKTASCINPYVYALSHPKFKNELTKICWGSSKANDRNKVWTTEVAKTEISTIGDIKKLRNFSDSDQSFKMRESKSTEGQHTRSIPLKRQGTIVEMICLRPSFSNNSSSFRRLARRWSSKEKKEKLDDADVAIERVSIEN
ncbi:opsin, ultraviolet-sensitive-like [Diorhabda carinulata]|uniref:opsin, ultraviolet-sensitive-like n=1 Tax=Diorhabda carinulata TaxID=1163345 RepID=UPI0025A1FAD7|nr:opsin, ultraviolet-sensitive-like [Diorhabda carinulata]